MWVFVTIFISKKILQIGSFSMSGWICCYPDEKNTKGNIENGDDLKIKESKQMKSVSYTILYRNISYHII